MSGAPFSLPASKGLWGYIYWKVVATSILRRSFAAVLLSSQNGVGCSYLESETRNLRRKNLQRASKLLEPRDGVQCPRISPEAVPVLRSNNTVVR